MVVTESDTVAPAVGWSPDGRWIAFDTREAGDWNIYVIDADGGFPRQLTYEPSSDLGGAWSHDGQWLYCTSDRSGRSEIWKIPAEGGQAAQVTWDGGDGFPAVSRDGRYLYYSKSALDSGIWRVPLGGGEETEVLTEPIRSFNWDLGRSGIYFAPTEEPILAARTGEHTIQYLDFESGQVSELFRREGPFYGGWPAVSPDEEWILYTEEPYAQCELMLMENFH